MRLHAAVRRDGELVAIDSRSWLVHQREVGAAYRSEPARELTELGFAARHTPLAHEASVAAALQTTTAEPWLDRVEEKFVPVAEPEVRWPEQGPEPVAEVSAGANPDRQAQNDSPDELEEQAARVWPTSLLRDLGAPQACSTKNSSETNRSAGNPDHAGQDGRAAA